MTRRSDSDQEMPIAARVAVSGRPSSSPFGPDDEIGMLNLMTDVSRGRVLEDLDARKVWDLSVDYFLGMPTASSAGDPPFTIFMSHTPAGSVIDDAAGVGEARNRRAGFSGDCLSMYTHSGTHIDTLNHFAYDGVIWNGFNAEQHLGSRHWDVCGADKHPPVIARGVLIDVAAAEGTEVLPPSFGIGPDHLRAALKRQRTKLRIGDVVLIRTGRISLWPDCNAFLDNEPGLTQDGARFLAESGAIMIGADNLALEQLPSIDPENWLPVHTFLLIEAGVPILEVANLEGLSEDRVYEFAFIGACLRIRGATGAPIRPIAIPFANG